MVGSWTRALITHPSTMGIIFAKKTPHLVSNYKRMRHLKYSSLEIYYHLTHYTNSEVLTSLKHHINKTSKVHHLHVTAALPDIN